ncbi:MAG: alpha/beta hydrolase [Lentisphaeria bacterium]|jgi:acetyl esterase/lipase
MTIIPNIVYNPSHGERGLGDLYLPGHCDQHTPIALSIHGGGWSSMDKSSFAGVAQFLCELGFATYNTHYRLCGAAPWPACGDDCLQAARFILDGAHDAIKPLDRRQIVLIGASAGGHLALMTGLRLPASRVRAVISISGVADPGPDAAAFPGRYRALFGRDTTQADLDSISPIPLLRPDSPRLLLTHCHHDTIVPIASATHFINAAKQVGAPAESYFYERWNDGHCIWIPGSNPHKLHPDIEEAIQHFLLGRVK